VYCVPDSEVNENLQGVYHFVIDENNNIVAWNDDRLGAGGVLDAALVPAGGQTGYELFRTEHPDYLIIGIVSISRDVSADELTYIDVRQRGGVLTDRTRRNMIPLLEDHPELLWVEDDSFHGRSIPTQGAFVVDLPFSALEEGGGDFEETEIETTISRHMALGSAPIIRYYADVPNLVGMEFDTASNNLTVIWTSVAHADSYRIYVSERDEGTYLSVDKTAVAGPVGSVQTVVGLVGAATEDVHVVANKKLYVYVAPLKDSVEWPASKVGRLDVTEVGDANHTPLTANLVAPPQVAHTLNANLVSS